MTRPALTWQLHWPTTLFVLLLLPCLLALGIWQLHRAEEKRVLQRQFDAQQMAAPIEVPQLTDTPSNFTRAEIHGSFDNDHSFLLDNRISHGRVGFEVLTPFNPVDTATARLLVNRGWIAGDPARRQLPTVPRVDGVVVLRGYIFRDTENRLVQDAESSAKWPRVIEQIDFTKMPVLLGAPTYPFTLRLDADVVGALQADWPVVTSSPERHVAYAVQWFVMAGVLAGLWLLRSSNLGDWSRST